MPVLGLPPDPPLAAWPTQGVIAILDLEFTAWDGSAARKWSQPDEWREIVQIGAVQVDAGAAFAVREQLEITVRPVRNPVLSDYFVDLTGIDQSRLDSDGVSFAAALPVLSRFIADAEMIVFNGYDGEVLRENCSLNAVASDLPERKMFNFRPLLAQTLGRDASELVSSELPRLAGISVTGRAHSAMHDCKAIAAAFGVWRQAGQL